MKDGERSAQQYDSMAVEYSHDNDESAFNAFYERPATISLLGDVTGRQVLEIGCGAGPLTAWLADNGAAVTAIDVSPAMLQQARERVGSRAALRVANLEQPLTFAADDSFDVIVGSLVLHYVRDWEAVLRELRRVLKPGGLVVFTTHHPTLDWQAHSPDDYFAIKQVTEVWRKGTADFEVTFWRRPLTAMTRAIDSAGFVIDTLVEPDPLPELRERDPNAYDILRRNPRFLFFRLVSR